MPNDFDFSVLRVIRSGKNKFSDIKDETNCQENQLDRALQRLRKRGLATFGTRTGWTAQPEQATAATA